MKNISMLFFISLLLASHNSVYSADKSIGTDEPFKVEIISPKDGEMVYGDITIEAKVNHPEAVEYCEFYIQEPGSRDRYGWKDYSPPYFWGGDGQILDTTMFNDGRASAVVFCLSKDKKPIKFENRVHFAIDNGKPKITILSPKAYDVVKGRIFIQVDARDSEEINLSSGITAMYLYLDGSFFEKMTNPPFKTFIETCPLSPGLHSIRVVAEDTAGLTATDKITINID